MDLASRKLAFIQAVLQLDNEAIISELEELFQQKIAAHKQKDIQPMSLEQFYKEIDQAIEDSENGRVIEASELKKKIKQWA